MGYRLFKRRSPQRFSSVEQEPSGSGAHATRLVLRERNLVWFVTSRFFSGAALTLLRAAFAWQVYAVTGSAFHLGLLGLVQFIPTLLLMLLAGAVADRYDRRVLVMLAQGAELLATAALALATYRGAATLPLIYAVVFATSAAAAFEGPARAALLPTLVPRALFPSAVAVHSTLQNLAWVTGPLLAGLVIAAAGVGAAYLLHVGLLLGSLAALVAVRS